MNNYAFRSLIMYLIYENDKREIHRVESFNSLVERIQCISSSTLSRHYLFILFLGASFRSRDSARHLLCGAGTWAVQLICINLLDKPLHLIIIFVFFLVGKLRHRALHTTLLTPLWVVSWITMLLACSFNAE